MQIKPEDLQALDGGKEHRGPSGLRLFLWSAFVVAIGTIVGYIIGVAIQCVVQYTVLGFILASLAVMIGREGDTNGTA